MFCCIAYDVLCIPDGIQCPMTDSCLNNSMLCDGRADCAVSGYDESPVICGTYDYVCNVSPAFKTACYTHWNMSIMVTV